MQIKLTDAKYEKWLADTLLLPVFENDPLEKPDENLLSICPWLGNMSGFADFGGGEGKTRLLFGPGDAAVKSILLCGTVDKNAADSGALRKMIGAAIKNCQTNSFRDAIIFQSSIRAFAGSPDRNIEELVFAALVALYSFSEFKSTPENRDNFPQHLAILCHDQDMADRLAINVEKGKVAVDAVILARNLDNMPANMLYPETLALRAAALARENGFTCRVLSERELEEENMNCLLAVGHGSCHPPRLVILEHAPEEHKDDNPLVFIGKGLTFDSGGICLKPAANMWQMKCDMSGAGAVLAVINAAAREKIDKRIIGILACAENMPGGKSFRPGDILRSASGETVEVMNTDAEGRLALCDALAYAQKNWQPQMLVDIATLTGACAIALGTQLGGLFGNNDKLVENILKLGSLCGENLWRLPLWSGYREEIKSPIADVRHTGSREGGAIIAALFLEYFIKGNLPWAHLDIAGVDWNAKAGPLCPEGATGFGTRILLEIARSGEPCL